MKFDDIKAAPEKYRAEFGLFLVEGEHLVLELQKAALLNPLLQGSELYVTNAYEQWQSPFKTHLISDRQMAQIADTKTPQGIVALVPMPDAPVSAPVAGERAIYLHEIQDPATSAPSCARWPGSATSAACSAPAASTRTTPSCARAWAPSSMRRWNWMWH